MFGELSARKRDILRAIIDAHIEGGEPVGSKYLTQSSGFVLSSATIRNEMAELEEMGYLEQPHTSAGRIPSELGYRFYVDSLMQQYSLTQNEIDELNAQLARKNAELDSIITSAGKVLTKLTNYTSLAVKSTPAKCRIVSFSVVPLDLFSFVLVTVLEPNIAKTKVIRTTRPISLDVLSRLQNVLNANIAGKDIDAVTLPVMLEMESAMGAYGALISPIVKYVYNLATAGERGELRVEGVDRLLQFPEFSDPDRLRSVLGMFDRRDEIYDMVSKSKDDRINIYIGSENLFDAMRGSSLVFKKIKYNGQTVGAIGVIGPCRMDYSRVVSALDYLVSGISGALGDEDANHDGTINKESEQ